ncbi:unnamed protein product [Chondrus crispus]|uniref:S1 motif domain-containing protein n=1 Tax=Chondrus crispus TaxID=2769 RepID=R7Q335_CHOCR|nr:unnamed protein product [Chondrus crispus]CDF32429.1 unnamed protein product [Chondrus crispus]|eukprot:XP_005712094.1 unnamed protein product [Chondrus crispus]
MNAPAFVLAAASPRAVLTTRPWLCGTRVATSPCLPTRPYLPARIFACTPAPAEEAAAPAEDAPAESAPAESAPAEDAPAEVAPAEDAPAETATPQASEEPAAEVVAEAPAQPSADGVEAAAESAGDATHRAEDADAEDQKKRKRRRSRKKEVTLPLEDIVVGQELEGVVKSVTDYGAFVGDMGTPTDGLLHVSQLAAGFVEKVTDIVNVGDKVTVRVMGVDTVKGNFSLTMKTAQEMEERRSGGGEGRGKGRREDQKEKWDQFKFDQTEYVDAKVTSVTDFGAFCQFMNADGQPLQSAPTEGLIHISEISQNRVNNVSDVLSVGQNVKVRVLATDRKRNRISMSLKEYSEDADDSRTDFTADMEKAASSQPTFKTSFEMAFEKANTSETQ